MNGHDVAHMQQSLALAALGRGWVEPNPLVGALVVQGTQIVGQGLHRRFGGAHAEVEALDEAGASAGGGTLIVTLEPCCHFGKTPPCTERIIASGVRRVVVAMSDPFGQVAGHGLQALREAGIEVAVGCLEAEARALNAPYLKLLRRGRPFVHAKWAMTLDGKIATVAGESRWITGPAARRHADAFRALMDGIVVGIETVLADDPMLVPRSPGPRSPIRVVLDSRARLPAGSKLVETAAELPTIVATTSAADPAVLERLRAAGLECLTMPSSEQGSVALGPLLDELGRRRWTNLLVEGGSAVLGAFLLEREIDAVRVYVSPRLVGGREAKGPIGGPGIAKLADCIPLGPVMMTELEGDICLEARVRHPAW